MADEEDMHDLLQGERDMARRDFRQAELSQLDLSERDFSGAHLEHARLDGANLSKSILSQSKLAGANAEGANLTSARAEGTNFFNVNLRHADLKNVNFSHSHFTRTDFTGADLRGANFGNAHFLEGSTFDDCETDETTLFEGVSIFRPLSRLPAFRFYEVQRGQLIRKRNIAEVKNSTTNAMPSGEVSAPSNLPVFDLDLVADAPVTSDDWGAIGGHGINEIEINGGGFGVETFGRGTYGSKSDAAEDSSFLRADIVRQADTISDILGKMLTADDAASRHGKIGHNQPPEATPFESSDYNQAIAALDSIREEAKVEQPSLTIISEARSALSSAAIKIASWVAKKLDLGVDEFAKQAGKTLGDAKVWIAGWYALSGHVDGLIAAVSKLGLLALKLAGIA